MIALLKALAAVIAGEPADRPFEGPFVTIQAAAPTRPRPYDWAEPDHDR